MSENRTSKNEVWYSFFFTLADCGHAAIIRCFLAPAYIPSIAGASGPGTKLAATDWFREFEDWVGAFEPESAGRASDEEIIKKRLKALGTHLCDAVKKKYGIDSSAFLGKNRNIIEFPEKFFQAVFQTPKKSKPEEFTPDNIRTSFLYFLVLQKIYKDLPDSLAEMLERLRELNRRTSWLHVPEIKSDSTESEWQNRDLAAYFLSAFALLSSARQVEQDDKNGIPQTEKSGILRQVQNFLEVPVPSGTESPDGAASQTGTGLPTTTAAPGGTPVSYTAPANGYVAVTVQELISLCSAALSAPDAQLLQTIYNICIRTPIVLQPGSSDAFAAKELITKISLCERKLISSMNQAVGSGIYDTVKELNLLVEIEKYWKNL